MSRSKKATSKWIPLSSVPRFDAIGKIARTRDGREGIIRYFAGRCAIIQLSTGKATVQVNRCEIMQSKQ